MAAHVSSISKALADHAAKGKPYTGLPTPPNSISPNLPAHSLAGRARVDAAAASPPSQVDSDIELGDAYGHAPVGVPADSGSITPALIARDFLPDIILGKGQVAVKDVISTLNRTLAGFADIPPAKARRIVVGALETRNGGLDGNVEFEKTGWGRWVGRVRQPSRSEGMPMQTIVEGKATSPIDIGPSPGSARPAQRRDSRRFSHGSWTHESTMSHSDRFDRMDTDVFHPDMDEMIIDGDDNFSRYTRSHTPRTPATDYVSDTDEEDWASIGLDALRANSYTGRPGPSRRRRTSRRPSARSTSSDFVFSARSAPGAARSKPSPSLDFTGVDADDQERAAIEALMNMGSA